MITLSGTGSSATGESVLTPPTVAPVLAVTADLGSTTADLAWSPSNKTSSPGFTYRADWRSPRPQKTVYSCPTGAECVTGAEGKYIIVYASTGVSYLYWFNTGTETEPENSVTSKFEVNIGNSNTAAEVATALVIKAGWSNMGAGVARFTSTENAPLTAASCDVGSIVSETAGRADGWNELTQTNSTTYAASFADAGGETYYFRVTPLNDAGEGPVSNTASINLPGESEAPALTGWGEAADGADIGEFYVSAVNLEWTETPGATNYDLYRAENPPPYGSGTYSVLDSETLLTYRDSTVDWAGGFGPYYGYKVIATNGAFSTPASDELIFSALPLPPPAGWLLATGFWNDAGVWDDTAFWPS